MTNLKLIEKDCVCELNIDREFLENYESEATRRTYKKSIEAFFDYVINFYPSAKALREVKREMVISYRNYLREASGRGGEQMAPNSIGKILSAISSYFEYLIEAGTVDTNPARSVKRPRREVLSPTRSLSKEQVRELFDGVESKQSGPLHLALIATLWLTGMRKSEVLGLRRKDYIEINGEKVLQYRGKGGKYRQKLVHYELVDILGQYLDWMISIDRKHDSQDWLFQPTKNPHDPSNLNKPINPRTLNRIVDKYSKKIGINFKVSPHSARATFISLLLDEGIPIVDVAREVAHSSIKTTQEYDKRRDDLEKSPVKSISY